MTAGPFLLRFKYPTGRNQQAFVSEVRRKARGLEVLVIRKCLCEAEPAHHHKGYMIDDPGLCRLTPIISGPRLFDFPRRRLDREPLLPFVLFTCEGIMVTEGR
jgi:hypothetical protein